MGNLSSSSKYITLQVKSTIASAGSILSGSILIAIPETVQSSSNNLLSGSTLLFIGKEDTKVEYTTTSTDSNGHTHSHTHYAYSKSDVIRAVIPLTFSSASNVHSAGSYEIPFQYKLPDDLPSSFFHSSHGGHCSIRYKLKLQLKAGGKGKEMGIEVISKPYDGPPLPQLVQPVTSPVMLCCCIPKGSITVAANVSNTRVASGEQVIVDLGAKNESSSKVDVITASIYQRVHWRAGGHSDCWDNKIANVMFRITDDMRAKNKESMRAIKQQQKRSGVKTRGPSSDVYREILNAVRDSANQVTLLIPPDANISYSGSLMSVNHRLCIKAKTPSCVTDPEIVVPLQVVSRASSQQVELPASPSLSVANAYPEGWNTSNVTTIPVVQSSYTSPVSYGGNVQTEEHIIDSMITAVPSAPHLPTSTEYTFTNLLLALTSSFSVKFKLEELLLDDQWKAVILVLKSNEFDAILQKVMMDFDKVDVANLLLPHIKNFTSSYAVAILRSVSTFLRIQFLQAMLPHIIDLEMNKQVVLAELSEWERICTERDFENAMVKKNRT